MKAQIVLDDISADSADRIITIAQCMNEEPVNSGTLSVAMWHTLVDWSAALHRDKKNNAKLITLLGEFIEKSKDFILLD